MGRSPCCEKVGLRKGTWTPEEDQKLLSYIEQHGHGSWRALPAKAGLQRCGKSCRLRWTNYLRPDIKRGKFSLQEEQTIIQLHALLGNRWSAIATHLPKRTDNEIKNYWNTHLKKRLSKMGIDPSTHKPKCNLLSSGSGSGQQKDTANLSHMAQWESARLEAESRLVRESKLIGSVATLINSHLSPTSAATLSVQSLNRTSCSSTMVPSPCLDILKAWQGTWKSNNNNNNGFFNPGGTLQSPTSTLHFSDNIFTPAATTPTAAATTCFGDNLPFSAISYMENPKTLKGNNTVAKLNDLVNYPIDHVDAAAAAAYFEDTLRPPSCFMEGFVDDDDADAGTGENPNGVPMGLFHGSSSGGDLEDNKKYWNSILNLENPTQESNVLSNEL